MTTYIGLIPAIPFLGFLILGLYGQKMHGKIAGYIGTGAVGISAFLTFMVAARYLNGLPEIKSYTVTLWQWISAGNLNVNISFSLDALSLIFIFVITFVGFLIHMYSIEFMAGDERFSKFFAYMNLFVGSMLVLVLANNMLVLYMGWEGVGLCSYLLIGFWYKEPENGYAARKAFIFTRVGDTAMILGIFLLFLNFGTLNIHQIMQQAPEKWMTGSAIATVTAALLLGGALGKSAQLPLQSWLPDAMAGPSPVSALIHAATMVTAGVYLIARTHILFALAPVVQTAVAVIGAATLLIAGFSALAQHDIKRILAYSTISQIGYMFLALGVGAWSAAVFHFMIHAFFKALLFLGAGAIILALDEEHDIFKMGGLRKKMPVIFITYLVASASLAALPLVTAGFYSKDQILWYSFSSQSGGLWLWIAGIFGAFLTALYSFRMVFITFYGEAKTEPSMKVGKLILIPLVVLAVLSVLGGLVELPQAWGNFRPFSNLLHNVLPATTIHKKEGLEVVFELISATIVLIGVYLAYLFYIKKPWLVKSYEHSRLNEFFYRGWDFDKVYDVLLVKPIVWLAEIDEKDFFNWFNTGVSKVALFGNRVLSLTQNGKLRWYLMSFAIGIALILTYMIYR
ncbi:MAG: NADH-quinone oxidoreductase subunit L [Bacteroidales bacterium]|nr:NADH-quinone oxidoreductase subunit L [Bacteroidales bacterium]